MPHDEELQISLPPRLSALPAARHEVEAFLGPKVPDRDLRDIVLCLQEAMKNAVHHSRSPDDLDVAVHVFDHTVCLVVRDHGKGFGAPAPEPGALAQPDLCSTSGRGLFLIGQLMDEVEVVCDRGVEVRMLKRVGAGHVAA